MEPIITYSIKEIIWDLKSINVISAIKCQIIVKIGDRELSQEFTSSLEFLDPTDQNFIDIRDMINSSRVEEAKPILLEFAKAKWDEDAYEAQIIQQNNIDYDQIEKIVQALTDAGVEPAEVEKQKQSLLNPEAITLDKFENSMINQLQNMIEDEKSTYKQDLITVF